MRVRAEIGGRRLFPSPPFGITVPCGEEMTVESFEQVRTPPWQPQSGEQDETQAVLICNGRKGSVAEK